MAKHPEWLEKMWEEQQSLIAMAGEEITSEVHIPSLEDLQHSSRFLEGVINSHLDFCEPSFFGVLLLFEALLTISIDKRTSL
jgi:hypothetical protein